MDAEQLKEKLKLARTALEGYWRDWSIERNRPAAATGFGMCRFSATFLANILDENWVVAGGEPLYPTDDGVNQAGYFDGKSWHGHYWVTNGELIVDLAASQFGGDKVTVVPVHSPQYRENYSELELEEHLDHVSVRADAWANDFSKNFPEFFAKSEQLPDASRLKLVHRAA